MEANYQYRQRGESSRTNIQSRDTFYEGDVKAQYNVEFNKVRVNGRTIAELGKVTAENSNLKDVQAQYYITLTESRAEKVKSALGRITASSCLLVSAEAPYDIMLKKVTAYNVLSKLGRVSWINPQLEDFQVNDVTAQDDISLENLRCTSATSKIGKITTAECIVDKISAQSQIILNNTSSQEVKSALGGVTAENCQIGTIDAERHIELNNCSLRSATSRLGNVKITSQTKQRMEAIKAQYCIHIENAEVLNELAAQIGHITAINCQLSKVSCREKLTLNNSSALSARIVAVRDQAFIELMGSTIEGDVAVESGSGADNLEVTLTVSGNGHIKGNILFQKSRGTVVGLDHIRGEVKINA